MKTNKQYFIGIDVSKLTIDACCVMVVKDHKREPHFTCQFENTSKGLKAFGFWLADFKVSMDQNSLVVIENTGLYQRPLWKYCSKINLPVHIGNAAQIKWSLGILRGKDDKIDSRRLCDYASKNHETLKPSLAFNPTLIS